MSDGSNEFLKQYCSYNKIERPFSVQYEFKNEAEIALQNALKLNPELKVKALSDPDLDNLRQYFKYSQLLNYSMSSLNDLFEILTNITNFSYSGQGIFAYFANIKFYRDLSFYLKYLPKQGDTEFKKNIWKL